MPRTLPVFPLGTVLFPYGLLPLHIFEERYRALMRDLLGDPPEAGRVAELGIVLIERGHEVGGGDVRSSLGTVARIVRADQAADGRWFVIAVGTHVFEVTAWLPDDPYPIAEIEECPSQDWDDGVGEQLLAAEQEVRRAIALASELGEPAAQPELSEDPVAASWQLCDALPVGPLDRQKLLSARDLALRMELLTATARDASSMLALRLRDG